MMNIFCKTSTQLYVENLTTKLFVYAIALANQIESDPPGVMMVMVLVPGQVRQLMLYYLLPRSTVKKKSHVSNSVTHNGLACNAAWDRLAKCHWGKSSQRIFNGVVPNFQTSRSLSPHR